MAALTPEIGVVKEPASLDILAGQLMHDAVGVDPAEVDKYLPAAQADRVTQLTGEVCIVHVPAALVTRCLGLVVAPDPSTRSEAQVVATPGDVAVAAWERKEPAFTSHQVRRSLLGDPTATLVATKTARMGLAESPKPPATPAGFDIPAGQSVHRGAFATDEVYAPFISKY